MTIPNRNFSYPTALKYGVGRIKELAELCKANGIMRPLFVTDPGLAVHPNDDALYVCDADTLFGLDPATGLLTPIGPLGLQGACRTLAAPQTAVACVDGW